MATQSPFSFLGDVFERVANGPQPPQWMVHEVQHRVVLLLNHVLMQEPAATQRLLPRRGRVVRVQWRQFFMALQVTPAGLFDMAAEGATPDMRLEVTQTSPLDLARPRCAVTAQRCVLTEMCSLPVTSSGWPTTCAGTWRKTWPD